MICYYCKSEIEYEHQSFCDARISFLHQAKLKLFHLANSLGISLEEKIGTGKFLWDGKGICIINKERNFCEFDFAAICHEMAHYILAPPENRSLPNFGLIGTDQNRRDEYQVLALQDQYLVMIGMPPVG